jgi:pimeloyl-ACP methyl ester carboxylesterase
MPESPYLLIHGLIGSLRDLLPIFSQHQVLAYAPDLLGYGSLQDVEPALIGLPEQVAYLAQWLSKRDIERVHLVGHCVGGVVAMLFAYAYPERVASIVSVEGNFSLADAFWSASVAQMSAAEAKAMLEQFLARPEEWLARSGIPDLPNYRSIALALLANQPAFTLQATARSVVEITGQADYSQAVHKVFAGPIPVHLVGGNRSFSGWSVPSWALDQADSVVRLPGGHLMMVEDPDRFVSALIGLKKVEIPEV